jgi:nocardicin N-oxygenase
VTTTASESETPAPATPFPFAPDHGLELHPVYEELRRERPVLRVELAFGGEGWLATRYHDIKKVLADPRFSRAAAVNADVPRLSPAMANEGGLLSMDPPDHSRLRRLVASAFSVRRIASWRPRTENVVAELIAGIRAHGAPADLIDRFCMPLPVTVICEMLGVPAKDRHYFQRVSQVMLSTTAATRTEIEEARLDLEGYLAEHIAHHRAHPQDDLLSDLIEARDEGDRLSEIELVRMGVGILVAGHETTANATANFVYTLITTGMWERVNDDNIGPAVEELLRYVSGGNGSGQARIATEDLELGGQLIRRGEAVLVNGASGNRDGEVFDNADDLDLGRESNPHIAFGFGVHHCLGAQLARMELRVGIGALRREFPALDLAISADDVPWRVGTLVRGPRELPVRW